MDGRAEKKDFYPKGCDEWRFVGDTVNFNEDPKDRSSVKNFEATNRATLAEIFQIRRDIREYRILSDKTEL
ncbi:unnamed protein product [Nesidiocoris tenuis]|uniref:Uncharacterized protein n=1 Tax=Nesidiocoris tenuis TaxID=355587 RepID=A0A6H5GHZ0_9HEMI|nr:unnamed protein product [Nesidiocoris tenuis]